jgi:KDO2-lipid IV(A) lauroyltransferase
VRLGERWTLRQRLKNDAIVLVVRAALAVVALLPRPVVRALCRLLGAVAWAVRGRERALCAARLAAGTGHPVPGARVRAAFLEAGATLADTLALLDPREPAARTLNVEPDGRRAFSEALAEGRGVVFVSAHLGSWERLAARLGEEGFPVATVARESYDPRLTELYERLRAPRGVRSIYRGKPGAATAIARELRAGRAVGFLVDLPARVPSVRVRLFGADAELPVGAARIALARRAAVLVGTVVPDADGARTIRIVRVDTEGLAPGGQGELALMDRLAAELEACIGRAPERWIGLFAPPTRGGSPAEDGGPPAAVSLRSSEGSR